MPSSLRLQRIYTTTTTNTDYNYQKKSHNNVHTIIPPPLGLPENIKHHHTHMISYNQSSSAVVQTISAPISTVWSIIRNFENPQIYKHFIKSCHVIHGDGSVGSVREVHVISGLPAVSSIERLDILDEECHIISFSVVGGDHRLNNYRSVTTLHKTETGNGTVVVESYVVDVPEGNTKEDTCGFANTIVTCNLHSLAKIAENLSNK